MRKTNSLGSLVSTSLLTCASAGCSSAEHADLFAKPRAVDAELIGSGGVGSLRSGASNQGLGGSASSGSGGKAGAIGSRPAQGSGGANPGSGGDIGSGGDVGSGGDIGSGGEPTCIPHEEVCDGIDNNCANGIADEQCAQSCEGVSLGGHGYMFCSAQTNQSEGITWQEAHMRCAGAGMAVVQLETSQENLLVGQRFAAQGGGGIEWAWIGASDATEGKWVWNSGEQFWSGDEQGQVEPRKFEAWVEGEPNGETESNCARIEAAPPRWRDTGCQMLAPGLICETK